MAKQGGDMQAFLIDFALGGFSGAVAKTLTAPIERIKLVVQTQDANPKIRSGEVPRYTGMVDCGQRIMKEQGFRRFWDGNLTNCIRYFPTQAFNLAFKDTFKAMFPKYNKDKEFGKFALTQVASGSFAGGVTNTLVYPLIYVRTVLGADIGTVKKYNSMFDCLVKTAKSGGVLSLYNGILASSVGIVVYRGAQFGIQDIVKSFNPYQKEVSFIGLFSKFCVAQLAVSISGIVAYPFDTMQRRLQIEASKPKEEQIYKNMMDCFSKILAKEGPGGFFKGALANILRGTGAAIVLVMYDEIMNAVERASK